MKFNTQLKSLRQQNQMTQEDLSRIIKVSRPTIADYESGKSLPPINTLVAISKHFKVTVDYLIGCGTDTYAQSEIETLYSQLNYTNRVKIIERIKTLLDEQDQ